MAKDHCTYTGKDCTMPEDCRGLCLKQAQFRSMILDPIDPHMKLGELNTWALEAIIKDTANDANYDPKPEAA